VKVLDLFSGTRSSTQAFRDAGHSTYSVELDQRYDADLYTDIMDLYPYDIEWHGPFDFIWASPPCTTFSVAALSVGHWKNQQPQTREAKDSIKLVAHTIRLIASFAPKYWVIENPMGMLRTLEVVRGIPLTTVSYCQYGENYQKQTDLFGVLPPTFRGRTCANGDSCHESAPRSEKDTGLQAVPKEDRSRVPYDLGKSILRAIEPFV